MALDLILIGVIVLLLAVVASLVSRNRRHNLPSPQSGVITGPIEADGPGDLLPVTTSDDDLGLPTDSVIVVPLPNAEPESEARALVMGPETALEALDRSGLAQRPASGDPGYVPKLARRGMAIGGQELTRRAQHGVDSGRIVRLSEESAKHLKKGKPVYDSADNLLGIVKGDKGKIQHVIRFDKAGAQAVVASNAATLAVTAALSAQLESIERQLEEISETLDQLVQDRDREKLATILGVNEELQKIARDVRRRGMTATDIDRLNTLALPTQAARLESVLKTNEAIAASDARESRRSRVERIDKLIDKERFEARLEYWMLAELALTRSDLLRLLWEQQEHPETAPEAARLTQQAIRQRQDTMRHLGQLLDGIADPSVRLRRDRVQLISRYKLSRRERKVRELLNAHGDQLLGLGDPSLEVTIPRPSM